ncbi:hypothetical protein D3C85_1694530 [compost metagenome]
MQVCRTQFDIVVVESGVAGEVDSVVPAVDRRGTQAVIGHGETDVETMAGDSWSRRADGDRQQVRWRSQTHQSWLAVKILVVRLQGIADARCRRQADEEIAIA